MAGRPASRARVEAIPKPGGGVRWITRLPPDRDRLYRTLVAPLVVCVERSLGSGVVANRARDLTSTPYSAHRARRRWRRLALALAPGSFAIVSDVRDCYASIGPAAVRAGLSRAGASCPDELEAFLRTMPLRGLPVGPDPSGVLANAVLAIADDAAAGAGAVVLRWVDDVVLAGTDRGRVVDAFDAWRSALAEIGLAPNEPKTRPVAEAPRAREALLGAPASGVGGPLRGIIRRP
jgi:hypothetical protein